jgi:predicted aspartyl protease
MPPIVKLCVFLCAFAFAGAASAHPGHQAPFPEPASHGDRADAPFDLSSRMATVDVMINGQGPFRLGVDTGADGYADLTPEVAKRLNLKVQGKMTMSDPTGRNPVSIPTYAVRSLAIGGVSFSNIIVTGFGTLPGQGEKVDGILGIDLFKTYLLTLDYAHGRFQLERGALPAADGKTVLDYRADGGLIELPLNVGGKTVVSHLDTGHISAAIAVPKAVVDTLTLADTPRKLGTARTVSNSFDVYGATLSTPVMVGSTPLTAQIEWPTLAEHANIGSGALAGVTLRIDQRNHRVEFTKAS